MQFDGIRAGIYKHCRSERGQAVSYNYRQVLGVLLSFAVKRRRVFPSLDTIARMAMVSKRTVSHAIAWLSLYGFLDKLRRIVRTSGLLGPRERQTSNAYVLCFPKGLGGLAVAAFKIHLSATTALHQSQTVQRRSCEEVAPDLGLGDPTAATPNEIPLEKKAGVLILPVMVNDGLPVDFVLDSGASDISMPAEMVEELVRSQGLTAADFTGQLVYQLADGTKVPSQTFRIRSLKLNGGDLT